MQSLNVLDLPHELTQHILAYALEDVLSFERPSPDREAKTSTSSGLSLLYTCKRFYDEGLAAITSAGKLRILIRPVLRPSRNFGHPEEKLTTCGHAPNVSGALVPPARIARLAKRVELVLFLRLKQTPSGPRQRDQTLWAACELSAALQVISRLPGKGFTNLRHLKIRMAGLDALDWWSLLHPFSVSYWWRGQVVDEKVPTPRMLEFCRLVCHEITDEMLDIGRVQRLDCDEKDLKIRVKHWDQYVRRVLERKIKLALTRQSRSAESK